MLTCGDILMGNFGCVLIQKPFMPKKLIELVNTVLHGAEEPSQPRHFSAGSSE